MEKHARVLASLRRVGISLDITVGSAHSGAALAGDRNVSRILITVLGLIFTGKVSLLVILGNKKLLPKIGDLKFSVLYFDPVILSDTNIEIETSLGLFAKESNNIVCFPLFFPVTGNWGSRFRMLITRGLEKGKIAISTLEECLFICQVM